MSMFKKTCFSCGSKVDSLYEGICDVCVKEQYPPIYEVKPMNFKLCNATKRVSWNNHYYPIEEFKLILFDVVKKHIVLNPQYELIELRVENIKIEGHTLDFDIDVDCNLKIIN